MDQTTALKAILRHDTIRRSIKVTGRVSIADPGVLGELRQKGLEIETVGPFD